MLVALCFVSLKIKVFSTAKNQVESETNRRIMRSQVIGLVCCLSLLPVSVYFIGAEHPLPNAVMIGTIVLIVIIPLCRLANAYINKRCRENEWHFLNMTWVTWEEFKILFKTKPEDFERVLEGFGKQLLPWEMRFLDRVRKIEKKTWFARTIGTTVGVPFGLVIGYGIAWLLEIHF